MEAATRQSYRWGIARTVTCIEEPICVESETAADFPWCRIAAMVKRLAGLECGERATELNEWAHVLAAIAELEEQALR